MVSGRTLSKIKNPTAAIKPKIKKSNSNKEIREHEDSVIEIDNRRYSTTDKVKRLKRQAMKRSVHTVTSEEEVQSHYNSEGEDMEEDGLYSFVGDGLKLKTKNTLRLYYNNCNGLAPTKLIKEKMKQRKIKEQRKFLGQVVGDSKVEKMLSTLNNWSVDIVCLSETNVAWEQPVARQIYNLVKKPFSKDSCWVTSSSQTKSASLVKPGGTAILIDANCTGNIAERGQDWTKMGRWSYTTMRGRNDRIIHIIVGYRCNNISTQVIGDTTAWAQQYCLSRQRGMQTPKPHLDFFTDLEK